MQPGKNRHGWITDVETSYQFFKEGNSANVLRDRPNFLGEFSSSAGEKRQQSLVSQPNISFSSLIFFFSCKQYALSEQKLQIPSIAMSNNVPGASWSYEVRELSSNVFRMQFRLVQSIFSSY